MSSRVLEDVVEATRALQDALPALVHLFGQAERAHARYCEQLPGHGLTDDEFDRALQASALDALDRLRHLTATLAYSDGTASRLLGTTSNGAL